ncbi:MAG: PEP-CTERM sorting domain-containing protein, partial [Bryobacteraceae bacterium]
AMLTSLALTTAARADVFSNYEDLSEGDFGNTLVHDGVTYGDVNNVSGIFPDGSTFGPDDLGSDVIVENAADFYDDFPGYGSPINALTFGNSFVPGPNLSIGPVASVWMNLSELSNSASLDLAYYENGPWGGIEYHLEGLLNGTVVASDSFTIAGDGSGRDDPTFQSMSLGGAEFDQLHLFAQYDGQYSAPRGMIDDLRITAVPEPGSLALLVLGGVGLFAWRTRRRQAATAA